MRAQDSLPEHLESATVFESTYVRALNLDSRDLLCQGVTIQLDQISWPFSAHLRYLTFNRGILRLQPFSLCLAKPEHAKWRFGGYRCNVVLKTTRRLMQSRTRNAMTNFAATFMK